MSSTRGSAVALLALALSACGGTSTLGTTTAAAPRSDDGGSRVTLYLDRVVVRQRVDGVAIAGTTTTIPVTVPRDVDASTLYVFDPSTVGTVVVRALADAGSLELAVQAKAPGPFSLRIGYTTTQLSWTAEYSMTTTALHDRSVLRGAVEIHNSSGVALPHAQVRLIDARLERMAVRTSEILRQQFTAAPTSTSPIAAPRDLGLVEISPGDTRIELLPGAHPKAMRSVLVYDAVGTDVGHPGKFVLADEGFGIPAQQQPRVSESLELARDAKQAAGLPGGTVRLFERHRDGSLTLLGQSSIFDSAARIADIDTVEIGTAEHVTGRRDRKDYTYDVDRRRLTEEFRITLQNQRPVPVAVIVREHLYRSENWTIAYASHAAAKEGPQQIALRVNVPANGKAEVAYVVVYTWEDP